MSPTFALVGVISSLGPFGAAKSRTEKAKDGHWADRNSCWIPILSHRIESNTISFQLWSQGTKKGPCRSLNHRTVPDLSPMEIKGAKLGRQSLRRRIGDHGVESEAREKTPPGFPSVSLEQQAGSRRGRRLSDWARLITLLFTYCAAIMTHLLIIRW